MIESVMDKKDNCFTFVRYIAAINVFLLHISHLVYIPEWLDKIIRSIHGIPMFFTLSGFLIWMSLNQNADFTVFIKKRVLRLYPEMWGGVLINAVIMIGLYGEHIEWKSFILFQITQGTIFQQWTPQSLRGYGCGTPNGVLGSISLLFQSYIALWFLYRVLHGRKMKTWVFAFLISLFVAFIFPQLKKFLPSIVYKILDATAIPSFRMFVLGAMVAEFFDELLPFLKRYWYIFLIVAIVMKNTNIPDIQVTHPIIRTIFIGLATLGFGYAIPHIKIKHDITYGIFIYHMIIINAFITIGYSKSFISVLLSLLITLLLAIVSYLSLGSASKKLRTKVITT